MAARQGSEGRFAALALGLALLLASGVMSPASASGEILRKAAARGDAASVARFITGRTPLNDKDRLGQTALLLAVAGTMSRSRAC